MTRGRRRRLIVISLIFLLTLLLTGTLLVYFEPFWVMERMTDVYLLKNDVKQRDVLVDGHRIHYLEALAANHDGPEKVVLLIHGLGAKASDWSVLTPELARHGYHVYAPDLLGYGRSDKPFHGDTSLATEERIVSDFIDTMHLGQPDVGGWSMGGWIAAKLALDEPKKVRRLMLFDSAGMYITRSFPVTLFNPTTPADLDALVGMIEPNRRFIYLPGISIPGLLRNFNRNAWYVNSSLNSMLDGREVLDFRLRKLKMPVLLVWGTEDKLIPLTAGEHMHALLPQSVLFELQGCGHLAIAECAAAGVPPVIRFLDAEPPLPAGVHVLPPTRR